MSEVNPNIGKPLKHHMFGSITSHNLDHGIGLSWRNSSVNFLIEQAVFYERKGPNLAHIARLVLSAALLKEDAIKHGINLEDKL